MPDSTTLEEFDVAVGDGLLSVDTFEHPVNNIADRDSVASSLRFNVFSLRGTYSRNVYQSTE
jgi:hypothetical protein